MEVINTVNLYDFQSRSNQIIYLIMVDFVRWDFLGVSRLKWNTKKKTYLHTNTWCKWYFYANRNLPMAINSLRLQSLPRHSAYLLTIECLTLYRYNFDGRKKETFPVAATTSESAELDNVINLTEKSVALPFQSRTGLTCTSRS